MGGSGSRRVGGSDQSLDVGPVEQVVEEGKGGRREDMEDRGVMEDSLPGEMEEESLGKADRWFARGKVLLLAVEEALLMVVVSG